MKYQTQKVAMLYFYGALTLFLAQVLFGVLAGTIYVLPNSLSALLPFNIVRMIHTNALIVWSLMGFMGATYYLLPEEAETELYSPLLANIQFWLFFGAPASPSSAISSIHEGREFLEQPFAIKVGIVVVCLIFLFNVTMTALKGRKTTVTNVLLFGLWGVAIFFLFAFYNPEESRGRQDVLVVRRSPVGRRRLGTHHGLGAGLPDDQAQRHRSRSGREVALRHRRPGAVFRHPGHRPSLLLDRRARLLAVDRRCSRRSRSRRSSPWSSSPCR